MCICWVTRAFFGKMSAVTAFKDSLNKLRVSVLLAALFSKIVSTIIHQVRCLKRSTLKLETARDLLLPRLMNGEIEV